MDRHSAEHAFARWREWDRPPLPTEAEKEISIRTVLATATPPRHRTLSRLAEAARALSLSLLFFGMGDCMALAAVCTVLAGIAAGNAATAGTPIGALLFLFAPLPYALLVALTAQREHELGTDRLLHTCRTSFEELMALRALAFAGAATASCATASAGLLHAGACDAGLSWALALSFASLFAFAALSLVNQHVFKRAGMLVAPVAWAMASCALFAIPDAALLLERVPPLAFALAALCAAAAWGAGIRRALENPLPLEPARTRNPMRL